MRAADKRLQEVRPDYLLSEQSAAVTHIHAHIVRRTRDGIIAGLSNMCRPLTLELSALQAMTGPFSEFHALVRSQEQQAGARLKQDIGLVMAIQGRVRSSNGSFSQFHTHYSTGSLELEGF